VEVVTDHPSWSSATVLCKWTDERGQEHTIGFVPADLASEEDVKSMFQWEQDLA
jgi:hypothetical protein